MSLCVVACPFSLASQVTDARARSPSQGLNYHGSSSDIWSCGIILFALLTGRLPFDDEDIRTLLAKVKTGKFTMPPELPSDAKDLIRRMLEVQPDKRITVRFAPRLLFLLFSVY